MIIEKSVESLEDVVLSEEELIENEIQCEALNNEIVDTLNELSDMTHSLEIFEAISNTITKCGGVTKSLEVMFGENFSSAASMEAEATEKKENIFKKAGKKLLELIRKMINWIKGLFTSNKTHFKTLDELEKKYGKVVLPKGTKVARLRANDRFEDEYPDDPHYNRPGHATLELDFLIKQIEDDFGYDDREVQESIKEISKIAIYTYRYHEAVTVATHCFWVKKEYECFHKGVIKALKKFESEYVNEFKESFDEKETTKRDIDICHSILKALHKAVARVEKFPAIAARSLKMPISKILKEQGRIK